MRCAAALALLAATAAGRRRRHSHLALDGAPGHHAIPRILVQTHDYPQWADAPPHLRATMGSIRKDNPDWKSLYFNSSTMRDFIERRLPGRVSRAYDRLNSEYGAARADFFRLCFLWVRGGIYMDAKSGFSPRSRGSLDKMRDRINGTILLMPKRKQPFWYSQYALAAAPRHPAIFAAISRAVHFIELESRSELHRLSGTSHASLTPAAHGWHVKLITGPHPYTLGVRDFYENAPPALLREWPPCFINSTDAKRELGLVYHVVQQRSDSKARLSDGTMARLHPDRKSDGHYTKKKSRIVFEASRYDPPPVPLSRFHNDATPFDFHLSKWPMRLGLSP